MSAPDGLAAAAPGPADLGASDRAEVPVLDVLDLTVGFGPAAKRRSIPLQGIHLQVAASERMALVGESGSGKSLTAAAVLGLLPYGAEVIRGSIRLDGEELIGASERRLRELRGGRMAIMFQNPRASLNPVLTVGGQIAEVIRVHGDAGRKESWTQAVDLLSEMGIPDAGRRAKDYVHQYSGGMAQRAALAMALSCRPDLLIADEPTTGLDATLQQQVLELVVEQVGSRNASLLLITHDIAVARSHCERTTVMYAGRVMESGPTSSVTGSPKNPYTGALLKAFVTVDQRRMYAIGGTVPTLVGELSECAFADRCPLAAAECRDGVPELRPIEDRHVACVKA
ncbi:MAG: ABC transporter ATP-binding protein [Acidimicrobiia bacterium]|nr:ABC transporter ATP-binding protein [Acidimicrobiia bacterium]